MFKRFRFLFRALTRRNNFEEEMSEELRFHIEQYTDDLVRSGMSREEAARQVRMELGNLTNIKGDCRQAFGLHFSTSFAESSATPLDCCARRLRSQLPRS